MLGVYTLSVTDEDEHAPPVTQEMREEIKEARRYVRQVRKGWIRKREGKR